MADFAIRFFLCNLFLSGIIGLFFAIRHLCRNLLFGRWMYRLWFLLLFLLAVPFLPFSEKGFFPIAANGFSRIASYLERLSANRGLGAGHTVSGTSLENLTGGLRGLTDFTLSVNSVNGFHVGYLLLGIWGAGILFMTWSVIKSALRLRALKASALPLENSEIRRLCQRCQREAKIARKIPVYSTAYLNSPVITGVIRPAIYLPLHLLSDCGEKELSYILMHELAHYRHRDNLANYLMTLASVLYWFNPLVRLALKEMRSDREIACDIAVLELLDEDSYRDYGHTLINFAEKVSLHPFPFSAGLGENTKQMKRRILNIAAYKKPTFTKKIKGLVSFLLIGLCLFASAPFLTANARTDVSNLDGSHYQWNLSHKAVTQIDGASFFGDYEGSFVLYDSAKEDWFVYDMERATLRRAPNSTYKIYDALFGLEEGIISTEDSLITWDKETYPFETWNADQTLDSAMEFSVNWYFQEIDKKMGKDCILRYLKEIGYGNANMGGNLSSYWLESSLLISPAEQVELLYALHSGQLGFCEEHIDTVKDAILVTASDTGTLYGKTGTGRVDGSDVNGWFVGFLETEGNTYYFATNIEAEKNATGSKAADITLSLLSDLLN